MSLLHGQTFSRPSHLNQAAEASQRGVRYPYLNLRHGYQYSSISQEIRHQIMQFPLIWADRAEFHA